MKKAITNCIIYTGKGDEVFNGVSILADEGRVIGFVYDDDVPGDFETIDCNGNNVAPAFIDLQIYGGNGHLFSADPSIEAIEATKQYCLSGGCSQFLLTMATNDRQVFSNGIKKVKEYLNSGGRNLLGLHLEGPWINPEKRGAHCVEFIHSPTLKEVEDLINEADGTVKMITLAPEKVDVAVIDLIQSSRIVVSAGHTNATYKQATGSFERINVCTHLFNAMSAFQSREPGMVGAIYDHPSVRCSMVADGIHVDFASIRISKGILGDRMYLITDAVAETNKGPYQHIFRNDRYVVPDGTLSGSALTMMKAVKNCVDHVGIELHEALNMASLYPARILGLEEEFGVVKRNARASFAVFDNDLNIVSTLDLT